MALIVALSLAAVPILLPTSQGAVVWDYTLTYVIDASGTTTYSVSGAFASHPECVEWVASSPVESTTPDSTHKHTYRVSLASGQIEQRIQEGGRVSSVTLTCPTQVAIVPNPLVAGSFQSWDNGCPPVKQHLTPQSNFRGEAQPTFNSGGTNAYGITTSQNLGGKDMCVVVEAGQTSAPVPFTGVVASWASISWDPDCWCDPSRNVEALCTPVILGGIPVGTVKDEMTNEQIPRCSFVGHTAPAPIRVVEYTWWVDARDISGSQLLGIGSYGGAWFVEA